MFAMIFMLFYEPVFTPYIVANGWMIEDNVGKSETEFMFIGYCLAIGCFTYAFASPLVGVLCGKI